MGSGSVAPQEITTASTKEISQRASTSTTSSWEWNLEDQESVIIVSVMVPDGMEPSDLELDVGVEHVRILCQAGSGASLDTLNIQLPRRVDPGNAPPAKYKKKGG